jgi:hypothetical protein
VTREKELLRALDILTEGDEADVPEGLRVAAKAAAVKAKAKPWTAGKGIQGLGIGKKITDGVELDELVIKVYVDKKLPPSETTNLVPRVVDIEGLDAIQTDVEAIGKVRRESNTGRVRPAIPGYSVGHVNITAGTLGCLVRKRDDEKRRYILSNSHVLADEGTGKAGDEILQPGPADNGVTPGDAIAKLSEWVPFDFTAATYPNLVDAAIAELDDAALAQSAIRRIGTPKGVSSTLRLGMQVQKCGRTTDYTIGVIRDVNYRTSLRYKKPGGGRGRVGFRDQILCTRFTDGGDSGSAVLNMRQEVVGLHFAGSPSSSIFNRIESVLAALRIEIVTT